MWGVVLAVIAAVIAGLFVVSATAALFALAVFLLRRSQPVPTPPGTR
jgi:hypothetical protein